MYFESFQQALFMGGHGIFVWPCFAITFLILIGLLVHPVLKSRKARQQARSRLKRLDLQKRGHQG